MELTNEQLEIFDTKGYLILRDFVSERECDAIRNIAKLDLENQVEPVETESEYNDKDLGTQQTVRRLRQVYSRDIIFREWMEDKNIRPILKQIFGETPVITLAHHNSIMTKMPESSTQTSWHQDIRYWNFSNDKLVSVWLALESENQENGVLEFIPGSHKMQFSRDQFDEKDYFLSDYEPNQKLISTKESSSLNKGDVVLFHCKLLHRANKNSTTKPKISFVYTVRAKSNPPIANTRSSSYPEIILEEES